MDSDALNEIFGRLSEYDTIIAYTEKNDSLSDLCQIVINEKYTLIDLSVDPTLEAAFSRFYNVTKYPVMISYGLCIYTPADDILAEREKRQTTVFVKNINEMVASSRIFLFIKGSPEKPACKFTRELVGILESMNLKPGIDYKYFDILSNVKIRSILKEINRWPTYPQIYIDRIFMGGLNDFKKMNNEGIIEKLLADTETLEKNQKDDAAKEVIDFNYGKKEENEKF